MSVDDIHQQLVWVTPSDIYMIRLKIFDLLRCCGVDTKDLMVKYHQNKTVVDDICKNKAGQGIDVPALQIDFFCQEELGEWEWNPDVPDMKLFRCWDSSATITKNEQFRNVTVSKEGELGGQEAAAMMLGALFGYSYTI